MKTLVGTPDPEPEPIRAANVTVTNLATGEAKPLTAIDFQFTNVPAGAQEIEGDVLVEWPAHRVLTVATGPVSLPVIAVLTGESVVDLSIRWDDHIVRGTE